MENLDALLVKIRTEGVDKARAEADAIVAQARKDAEKIVATARSEAEQCKAQVQADADRFQQGAEATLRQAARDVRMKLEQDITSLLERTLGGEVDATLEAGAIVGKLVEEAVETYLRDGAVTVAAAPKLAEALKARLAQKGEVTVVTDAQMGTGFRVLLKGGRVEHDFTGEAVTQALTALLRPQLAKLLKD